MTDEQIDNLIERLKPNLRIALRAMIAGYPVHIFNLDGIKSGPQGVQRMEGQLNFIICNRYVGAVLEWAVHGMEESNRRLMEDAEKYGLVGKEAVPS